MRKHTFQIQFLIVSFIQIELLSHIALRFLSSYSPTLYLPDQEPITGRTRQSKSSDHTGATLPRTWAALWLFTCKGAVR